MALVAFLQGVNVGGHRRLRPSVLAKEQQRFDVVSIGAAGILVVRPRPRREMLVQVSSSNDGTSKPTGGYRHLRMGVR